MNFVRSHWRTISTAMMVATALSVGGARAYAAATEDCCKPGAACCHPGAACCHHAAGASGQAG